MLSRRVILWSGLVATGSLQLVFLWILFAYTNPCLPALVALEVASVHSFFIRFPPVRKKSSSEIFDVGFCHVQNYLTCSFRVCAVEGPASFLLLIPSVDAKTGSFPLSVVKG